MRHRLHKTAAAALILLAPFGGAFLAGTAHAQQPAVVAGATIHSFTVNADRGLAPGSTLRFEMRGTPNARNTEVRLGGTDIAVRLEPVSGGLYRGTYVVRGGEGLDARERITVRLADASGSVTRHFTYPPSFLSPPMGAAPAAGPAPTAIERFTMRPQGRIEPGRELRFRLHGVPGGDAWVDIPGVINGVDLAEVRPGLYEGTYTVRWRDDADAFDRAVATLRQGNRNATAQLERERDRDRETTARDRQPPQVSDLQPPHGARISERGQAHITARVTDEGGSGLDNDAVRLRVDGRDVSRDVRVDNGEIHYRDNLQPGRYTAELTVRDNAGNTTQKTWSFDVIDRERVGTAPAGVLPLQVTSHSNNATIDADGRISLQGRTAPFASVRVHIESVSNVGGVLGLTQPVMDQTIQADRNGNFSVAVAPNGLPIPGARYEIRVTSTSGTQTAEERLTLHRRG